MKAKISHQARPAVFLDRDGVINKKMPAGDYVKSWREFEFLPGAIEAIKLLKNNNYLVCVVSNQAGVGRGLMSRADLAEIQNRAQQALDRHGVAIDAWYYCLHAPEHGCDCRKPKAGLLLQAAQEHNVNLSHAVMIGDSPSDAAAGQAAGCRTILIKSGELLDVVKKLI